MTNYSEEISKNFNASQTSSSGPVQAGDLNIMIELTNEAQENITYLQERTSLAGYLYNAGQKTGNYVILSKDFGFLPGLIDNNQEFISLFRFIEVMDELIDYDRVIQEFPSLSYSHISGAISFLRKVAQFNLRGYNIDEIMDDELVADEIFLSELRQALANQEVTRVLNFD